MDSNLLNLQLWDPRGNEALSGIGTMQGEISEYKAGVQLIVVSRTSPSSSIRTSTMAPSRTRGASSSELA
jgi:hypothetical protein